MLSSSAGNRGLGEGGTVVKQTRAKFDQFLSISEQDVGLLIDNVRKNCVL